jgi:membrane protease YdiL (CAAX protease family)
MKLLTLSPDARAYLVALVGVFALACGPAAEIARALWPADRRPRFVPVYIGTLGATAAVALVTLKLPSVMQSSAAALAGSVLVGVPAGAAASWCDDSIRRSLGRRIRQANRPDRLHARSFVPVAAATRRFATRSVGVDVAHFGVVSLTPLVAIALLEELLFRGVIVDLSRELPVALAAACIVSSLLVFAGSHVYWGWGEVVAKIPLGVAALIASLPFRAVLGAVAAHVVFNARSWFVARGAGVAEPGRA